MEEWGKNGTEESCGLREKQERGRRSTGTQGRLFSALLRDVTAMLTWPTPCPSPTRHPAQPWPPGPPSWSQAGQEVWGWVCIQTQHRPHCLAQALAISSVPLWDLGVGWWQEPVCLAREEGKCSPRQRLSKEAVPALQQPLGAPGILPEGQETEGWNSKKVTLGHLESDRVEGGLGAL